MMYPSKGLDILMSTLGEESFAEAYHQELAVWQI